jgi:Carboxypeptidase regulatory-like domain
MKSAAGFLVCVALICGAQLKLSPTWIGLSLTRIGLSTTPISAQAPARDNVAPPVTGTARVIGRVVTADTGNPVARAQVQISSPALAKPRQVTTDTGGRYEITGLPPGRYRLSVSRLGFVAIEYGQTRPFGPGRDLELLDGQTVDRIDFALSRGGVITGRVTDQNGEPQPGMAMAAMRFAWTPGGIRTLERTSIGFFGGIVTDDLGQFRIYGLEPGSYVVASGAVPGAFIGPEPRPPGVTYFPGTANVDEAQPVQVEIGQEVSAHFSLVSTRLARVSGTVVDSAGRPVAWRQLVLASRTEGGVFTRSRGTTRPDGTFDITDVAPGTYTIELSPVRSDAADREFASFPISVEGHDITDLMISTKPEATVRGRVVWEGSSPEPFATQRITVSPADPRVKSAVQGTGGGTSSGVVDATGSFSIIGVHGHIVFQSSFTGVSGPWHLKAVRLGSADITDVGYNVTGDIDGLEVVMTDRETRVSGHVRGPRNQPVIDYIVVFLPGEEKTGVNQTRFVHTARPDQQGRYQVKGLPPGQYVAGAFESLGRDGHYNPEFQKRLRAAAKPFSVKEGQELQLDLQLMQ